MALRGAFTVFIRRVATFAATAFNSRCTHANGTNQIRLPRFRVLRQCTNASDRTSAITNIGININNKLVGAPYSTDHRRNDTNFRVGRFANFSTRYNAARRHTVLIFRRVRHVPLKRGNNIIFRILLVGHIRRYIANAIDYYHDTYHLLTTRIFQLATGQALVSAAVVRAQRQRTRIFRFRGHFQPNFARVFGHILIASVIQPFRNIMRVPFPIVFVNVARHGNGTTLHEGNVKANQRSFERRHANLTTLKGLRHHTRAYTANAGRGYVGFSS